MPYIPQDKRPLINLGYTPINIGELNYAITRMVLMYLPEEPRYADYNEVIGVLECVKQEFYRRAAAPYEDKKAAENGDLEWPR